METFSTLLAICARNSPVTGEFPAQWPGTWSFDVFFDLYLNKRLSKQSWVWWFKTPLWRHCTALADNQIENQVIANKLDLTDQYDRRVSNPTPLKLVNIDTCSSITMTKYKI